MNLTADDIMEEMDKRDALKERRLVKREVSREYIAGKVIRELNGFQPSAQTEANVKAAKRLLSSRSKKQEEEAWMVVSDLHHCREVKGVINEKTTAAALEKYVTKSIELVERQRRDVKIETLNLAVLGDILHGVANFGSQARETSGNASHQIASTAKLLISQILRLRSNFKRINVYMVPGNHGRRTREDDVMTDNLELDMYRIVEAYFSMCPDVTFEIASDNFYIVADSLGRKILLMHGDQIKGTTPQTLIAAFARYTVNLPEKFDEAVMGHVHRLMLLPMPRNHDNSIGRNLMVNGTASIGDVFLVSFGGSPSLSYWTFFCNGKRITARYDVDLYA
jgi:UDP-2,3-diacylglucosamine pyrophosphatase LpxH